MGITLPAATSADSFRNHPVQQSLHLPILHKPHQPTTQTRRPLRRRIRRTCHLPSYPRQHQKTPSSARSGKPLSSSTRDQHIPALLLPQRHLRLPHSSPRNTHPNPATILHRDDTPGNSDDPQDPPYPSSPTSHDLADPNPRPTQDPAKSRNLYNHHHPGPNPAPNYSRLPAVHHRIQPHQPRKRNNTHHDRSTQHNPTFNTPTHIPRIFHQPDLDRHNSSPIHRHSWYSLDESTKP